MSNFVITASVKKMYASLFILQEIAFDADNFCDEYEIYKDLLSPFIRYLTCKSFTTGSCQDYSISVTRPGQDMLKNFRNRYLAFLTDFDVYCGVDINALEFAYNYIQDFQNTTDWQIFINQDKWIDLRIAVAEYCGFDATEIVFMNFVYEQKFGKDETGWSEALLTGSVWSEIQTICNNAVRLHSLARLENGTIISGESIMGKIIASAPTRRPYT